MASATCTSADTLTVERLTSLYCNAKLKLEWNGLAGDNPFLTWDWLECWWRHYGADATVGRNELCVLAVRDAEGRLVGLAPWYLEHSFLHGHIVRFLGSGEICSDYQTILSRNGYSELVTSALSQWLVDTSEVHWDVLDFQSVASRDAALSRVADSLESFGCHVSRRASESCWQIELPSDWETYLRSLSKSRREKVRKVHRRLLDSGMATLHQAQTEQSLEAGFSVLRALHQSRRNSLGQAGCFASPKFIYFHQETTRRLLQSGHLRLTWLTIDNAASAAEYSFMNEDTVFFYQSGINPELAETRSGWLSITASIRFAIENGYRCYDLLRGNEPYKASLGAKPIEMVNMEISNRRISAKARQGLRQGIVIAKSVVKNVW